MLSEKRKSSKDCMFTFCRIQCIKLSWRTDQWFPEVIDGQGMCVPTKEEWRTCPLRSFPDGNSPLSPLWWQLQAPTQYSCLEDPMDGGAWWASVHGVSKSQTGLSDFTFTFHFHALEKEMATHSSVLAWRIPGTEEPGGLLSMGSHRVRHD